MAINSALVTADTVEELQTSDYFPANEPVLLGYQARWIQDDSEVKIGEKSRRTGLTWAEATDNVITASKPKKRGGRNVFYIGSRQEMALEYIAACALFAKAFNQLAGSVDQSLFKDEDGSKEILAYTIRFPNSGFKITALSSRPSNLRGMQGDVVIDEAAFHDSLHELLKAAMALTMWGARVRIISTHNGVDNEYNQYVEDARAGRKPYSIHRITLDDALADGLFKRICFVNDQVWSPEAELAWRNKTIANAPSKEAADEEYFCVPSQSGGAALSRVLIEARMSKEYPVIRLTKDNSFNEWPEHLRQAEIKDWCDEVLLPELNKLNPKLMHAFGEDFGRLGDLTVIDPITIEQNLDRTVPFSAELRNIPFKQQEQVLFYIVDRLPRLIGGALDAGGNGMYLAEQARHRYGSGRIQEIKLSESWYLENMPKLKAAFEDAKLTIPADADQLNDLRALQVINGIIRLPKVKTETGANQRHGDSAISKALAYFASLTEAQIIEYNPVPSKEERYWENDDLEIDRTGAW
jgi:phage FluMu gp28-like protein